MHKPNSQNTKPGNSNTSWRYRLGMLLFFGAFPIFFATPVVIPMLGLSAGESAALIGGILLGVEVLWFASIPLLGKEGFNAVKQRAFGWIKLSSGPISQARHRFGVTLLLGSILLDIFLNFSIILADLFINTDGDLTPSLLGMNFEQQTTVYIAIQILTTIGVMAAVLILGGDFWERLKNAVQWQANPDR